MKKIILGTMGIFILLFSLLVLAQTNLLDPAMQAAPEQKEEEKEEPPAEEIPTILPRIPETKPVSEPIRPLQDSVLQIIKEALPPRIEEKAPEETKIIEIRLELAETQNAIRDISRGLAEKQTSLRTPLPEKIFKQSQIKQNLEKQINHAKEKIQIKKEARQEKIAEEEITIITTIVSPKEETQYNVVIYEIIAKEIAQSAADLIFYGDVSIDIIRDDPIIAWHLPVVDKEIKLHYAVRKKADLVLEKIQTLPANQEEITKKETIFQKYKLFLSILLTVFIILMVILIKKIERQLR